MLENYRDTLVCMGKLEIQSKKRRQKQNIQKIVLGTLKASGVLAFGLMAPNALKVLEQIDPSFKTRKRHPKCKSKNCDS